MASMNAPMPESILHDGQASNRRARGGRRELRAKNPKEVCAASLAYSAVEFYEWFQTRSGRSGLVWQRCGVLHALGSALAYEKKTDALQKIGGRIHASGQEYVGLGIVIVDANFA